MTNIESLNDYRESHPRPSGMPHDEYDRESKKAWSVETIIELQNQLDNTNYMTIIDILLQIVLEMNND